MLKLFSGYSAAYGIYRTKGRARPGEKHKGVARTVHKPVTEQLWTEHLAGETPLGIITITAQDTCHWGAIDVDIYNLKHLELRRRIDTLKLPLIPCRSKSGGAHIFLFVKEPVPAALMQDKLTEFASALGLAGQEIFPKQRYIDKERNDLGSWLNMPYFCAKDPVRYAYDSEEKPLTVTMFLALAKSIALTPTALERLEPKKRKKKRKQSTAPDFYDGPVCFQTITDQGPVPEGTRNISLLNMGIYAKKRWPNWEKELARLNQQHIDPPLPTDEVAAILKSLRKKEYHFNCKAQPLVAYCNAALCKTREFGIGGEELSIRVTELRKLDTDPPLWFMDIEGMGTVQMSTDQLNSAIGFTKCCMEQLSFRPTVSGKLWTTLLGVCFEKLIIIEMSEEEKAEGSVIGAFEGLVAEFLQRPTAETWEEIILRKPFRDNEHVYFRFNDMINWISKQGFRDYGRNEAINVLRSMGAQHQRQRKLANGRVVRLWRMPIVWAEGEQ